MPSATSARAQSSVSAMLGAFLQLEPAQAGDELGDLRPQPLVELRHLEGDDLALFLDPGELEEEV